MAGLIIYFKGNMVNWEHGADKPQKPSIRKSCCLEGHL